MKNKGRVKESGLQDWTNEGTATGEGFPKKLKT